MGIVGYLAQARTARKGLCFGALTGEGEGLSWLAGISRRMVGWPAIYMSNLVTQQFGIPASSGCGAGVGHRNQRSRRARSCVERRKSDKGGAALGAAASCFSWPDELNRCNGVGLEPRRRSDDWLDGLEAHASCWS